METLTIEFQPNIKEKLMAFLNSFKPNEVQIVEQENTIIRDHEYWAYRKKLHDAFAEYKTDNYKTYSFDELDAMLEETIAKYEN